MSPLIGVMLYLYVLSVTLMAIYQVVTTTTQLTSKLKTKSLNYNFLSTKRLRYLYIFSCHQF